MAFVSFFAQKALRENVKVDIFGLKDMCVRKNLFTVLYEIFGIFQCKMLPGKRNYCLP